jgi:hypothetical protein
VKGQNPLKLLSKSKEIGPLWNAVEFRAAFYIATESTEATGGMKISMFSVGSVAEIRTKPKFDMDFTNKSFMMKPLP